MTTLAPPTASPSFRTAGRSALASGALGIAGFGLLIAYLATAPKEVLESEVVLEPGAIPLLSRLLLGSSDLAFILQALCMIPVALLLHAISRQHAPRLSRVTMTVGVMALGCVALLRLLAFTFPERVSGILFMGPTAFLGAWLLVINWILARAFSRGLRVTGATAGVGLLIQGASFFFLGGLLWIWAILVGRKLLRTDFGVSPDHSLQPTRSLPRAFLNSCGARA